MKSDSINELATALSKAQGQMTGAIKDSTNPFFKATYADLASVWEACRKPLSDNGLSVVQTIEPIESTEPGILVTWLLHSSGQYITSSVSVKAVPNKGNAIGPQEIGSALTYMRRYALAAIVGIAPEDDDGEAAQGRQKDGSRDHKEKSATEEAGAIDNILKEIATATSRTALMESYNKHSKWVEGLPDIIRSELLLAFTNRKKALSTETQ